MVLVFNSPIACNPGQSLHFVLNQLFEQTTELCAKQDAYYRGVVSDLENQIKESIAGRDHVLAIRYGLGSLLWHNVFSKYCGCDLVYQRNAFLL